GIEQQEIDLAQQHAETVLRVEPDNARGWFAKGLVHMWRQEHAEAITAIETALERTPDHVGTIVTLGWARFAAREVLGAERTFRRAIEADGTFAEAHGGLAVTLIFQKRIDEARRETQIARRLSPNSLGAIWARGTLLALGGRKEAGGALGGGAAAGPAAGGGQGEVGPHSTVHASTGRTERRHAQETALIPIRFQGSSRPPRLEQNTGTARLDEPQKRKLPWHQPDQRKLVSTRRSSSTSRSKR